MSAAMAGSIALGMVLLYVIPAVFGAAFWACVWGLARLVEGRDVMSRFRPHRRDVAAADRKLDDLHIGLHYEVIE